MRELVNAAEQVALFCRLNMNVKKDLPIRSSEMGMLIYLVKTEGEKTPVAVANYFKVTKGMVTKMVSALIQKGYLKKERSKTDLRSFILLPTEEAVVLVNGTYDENFKVMHNLQEKLGEAEFAKFMQMLENVNSILLKEKENG